MNMTENQVTEIMRGNAELVGYLKGEVHTYKVEASKYNIVMGSNFSYSQDAEFLVTVFFKHGRVADITSWRYF